jgi:hypothetical protein
MHTAQIEVYSDASNSAVMKYPGRKFPGVLIQGDTLHNLCCLADEACREARKSNSTEAYECMNEVRNSLWDRLNHYSQVLEEHGMQLPFNRVS